MAQEYTTLYVNYSLWLSVLVPALAGVVSGLIGKRVGARVHATLAVASWIAALALLAQPLSLVIGSDSATVIVDAAYAQVPGLGTFSLFLDGVSAALAIAIVAVSALIAAYSVPYMEHRFHEMGIEGNWGAYFLLYQLFTAGMLGAVLSGNAILFYLFLELTLIPSALLIVLYGYGERIRVGLIYIVWTHIGALLFLLGLFLAKAYDFYIPGAGYVVGVSKWLLPMVLIVIGLGVKSAYAGLHLWLPYAHAEAPTPVSALLSPLLIGIGGYALIRAGIGYFPELWISARPLLYVWAVVTMIYGGFLVLAQRDVKRLFAYSSISQMGYMLLGLAMANPIGEAGAVLHYVTHALGKAILFGVAGVFIVTIGTRRLDDMGGLLSRMPMTGAVALAGFLLISGLPPTLGLWSEVYLAFGYVKWGLGLGLGGFVGTAAFVVVGMTLTAIYSFLAFKNMFLGESGPKAKIADESHARGLLVPLLLLAVLGVVFFIGVSILAQPALATLEAVYTPSALLSHT
ncbi:MAG: complex I subunit 5 family protein [Thermoproteota archaeon]